MFIGYPRSSHSLVAAILDAHPEIIIANEYDVVENWQKYHKSFKEAPGNLVKYQLFYNLHELSIRDATFGRRANSSLLYVRYSYRVPGLWQGGYFKRIKVSWSFMVSCLISTSQRALNLGRVLLG